METVVAELELLLEESEDTKNVPSSNKRPFVLRPIGSERRAFYQKYGVSGYTANNGLFLTSWNKIKEPFLYSSLRTIWTPTETELYNFKPYSCSWIKSALSKNS